MRDNLPVNYYPTFTVCIVPDHFVGVEDIHSHTTAHRLREAVVHQFANL